MSNDYVKDCILTRNSFLSDILKRKQLQKILSDLDTKKDNYDFLGKKVWMLLNLQLWGKNFL